MITPVVLLAFANDRAAPEHYLRDLADERREILNALDRARSEGRCEVKELPFATAPELFDAFRRRQNRNRIAIFHFAGHADSTELLLESAAGEPAVVGGAGLAAFLGGHRGIQLVFLNACATQGHVQALLDAGIAAVISTSREVQDEVARHFAASFYRELGEGSGISRAFEQAGHEVEATHPGDGRIWRHLRLPSSGEDPRPWRLCVRKEDAPAELWTLGTPPLPPVPRRDLPERPFRHLHRFAAEHAELFFGRAEETWHLLDHVTAADGAPVVLLYGQSGVGKSSLLEAGLLPRLGESWEVLQARGRDGAGLVAALAGALGVERESGPDGIAAGWREIEERSGKPLLVILDQVEEAFTRGEGGAGEMDALARALGALFREPERRPRGKVVLGFRKEWLAEVENALGRAGVPRATQFVSRLSREGVVAAITGPTRDPRLQRHYGVTVEDGLAERIAGDLLRDEESHIAPLLQILLAGMWDAALARSRSAPAFDAVLYQSLTLYRAGRDRKLLLDDFLGQQLAALQEVDGGAEDSGLALDYLAFHTTPYGTARERTGAESAREYAHQPERADALRRRGQELYLLADASPDDSGLTEPCRLAATRLAHDTLAPLVRRRFEESDAPGQRARRILESRAADWSGGRTGPPLDAAGLALVEKGVGGMRAWTDDERRLVEASRIAIRLSRRRLKMGALGFAVIAVGLVVSFVLLRDWRARSQSSELATHARALDKGRRDVALLLAVAAYERKNESFEARRALFSLLAENPYLAHLAPEPGQGAVLAPDGESLVGVGVSGPMGTEGGFANLAILRTPLGTEPVRTAPASQVRVRWNTELQPRLSAEGTRFLGVTAEDSARNTVDVGVWDVVTGNRTGSFRIGRDQYATLVLAHAPADSPNHAAMAAPGAVVLLGNAGREMRKLAYRGRVARLVFSHDGSILVAISGYAPGPTRRSATAWRTATGEVLLSRELAGPPGESVAVAPHNGFLAVGGADGIHLWPLGTGTGRKIPHTGWTEDEQVSGFTKDGRYLLSRAENGEITLLEVETAASAGSLQGFPGSPLVMAAPLRNRVASQGPDGMAYVWDFDSTGFARRTPIPVGRDGDVVALSPGTERVAVRDGTGVTIWDVRTRRPAGPRIPWNGSPQFNAIHLDRGGRRIGIASFRESGRLGFAVHEVATGARIASVSLPAETAISTLVFSPDGEAVAARIRGSVVVTSLPRSRDEAVRADALPGTSDGRAPQIAFSPDGTRLAWRNSPRTLRIWDRAERQERESLAGLNPAAEVAHLLFSGDGQVVAVVQASEVRYWRRGAAPRSFRVSPLNRIALNHDGTLLATSGGGRVVLWDVERGDSLGVLRTLDAKQVSRLAFSEGGARLVIAYEDRVVESIAATPEAWAEHACALAASAQVRERWKRDAPDFAEFPSRCAARLERARSSR